MKASFVGVIRVFRRRKLRNERIKFSLDFSAFGDELGERNFDDNGVSWHGGKPRLFQLVTTVM